MMSESEICESYRNAKHKSNQIDILAQLNDVSRDNILEVLKKHDLLSRPGLKPKACVPEQKETSKMPEKETNKEAPKDTVPHIRVPIPPIVIQAVEEKMEELDSKISYHEEQVKLLSAQYKEIVAYLDAEGSLRKEENVKS